jgi:hypothetical protein
MFVFLVASRLKEAETKLLQAIDCEKKFISGFPLRIHRLTTTWHVKPITMGPRRGSLKVPSIMNGRQQVLFYGRMGIVWFSFVSPPLLLITSGSVAGSGKSVLWWVIPQPTFVDIAYYIGDQFFDHKGHRIHTCNWIGFSCILLL